MRYQQNLINDNDAPFADIYNEVDTCTTGELTCTGSPALNAVQPLEARIIIITTIAIIIIIICLFNDAYSVTQIM
jgi:hypothetical protein